MVHLKFQDPGSEKQEEILEVSREHVTNIFGESIRKYVGETGEDFNRLIEEETIKNLYTYKFMFTI